jgi:hypothetical protein
LLALNPTAIPGVIDWSFHTVIAGTLMGKYFLILLF